jgi:8-oxo-dGTP diphosphatase
VARPPGTVTRVSDRIDAAGGVVVRDGMVLLVHRPRYDDWTFPKGKLDPGESFEDAAVREVEEETGVRCSLDRELASTRYEVGGRPKLVRYWLMTPEAENPFEPNDETDDLRWLAPEDAKGLLTYARDRELLRVAVGDSAAL